MQNNINEYFEYKSKVEYTDYISSPLEVCEYKSQYDQTTKVESPNNAQNKSDKELFTRKEAAHYIKMSAGTLAVWASTKRYDLKPIKVGTRAVRYWRSELDKFLLENPKFKK